MKWRVLNVEPLNYSKEAVSFIKSVANYEEAALSYEELEKEIPSYDVLITRIGHKIDESLIDKAVNLKAIVTATTGLNHINVKHAQAKGISVLSLKGEEAFLETVSATAEHSFALLLALTRKIPAAVNHVKSGQWNRDVFKGIELKDNTVGIIGYGRLGKKMAQYCNAFGMKVLAYDISQKQYPPYVQSTYLDVLLAQSDIISVHASYAEGQNEILTKEKLLLIKKGAYLINTARGELIDNDVVVECLKSGQLKGAALDVLPGENTGIKNWAEDDPIIKYSQENDNLIITPHIGGATLTSMSNTEKFMAQKLVRFIVNNQGVVT